MSAQVAFAGSGDMYRYIVAQGIVDTANPWSAKQDFFILKKTLILHGLARELLRCPSLL